MVPPKYESERAGSGFSSTSYSRQGNQSVRRLLIACDDDFTWEDRQDKVLEILGHTEYDPDEKKLLRYLPWFDPEDRAMPAVGCVTNGIAYDKDDPEFTADEAKPMATANRYKYAEFVINFQTVRQNFGVFDDPENEDSLGAQLGRDEPFEQERYTIKRVRPGRDFVTAKPGTFVWADMLGSRGTQQVGYPLPEILPYQEIDVTWLDIPIEAYPSTAIADCLGKINSNEDFYLGIGGPGDLYYPAESLLLQAISEEESFFSDHTLAFNLTYHFKARLQPTSDPPLYGGLTRVGWNVFPYPNGSFRPLFREGTDTGVFLTSDFSTLFLPEGAG